MAARRWRIPIGIVTGGKECAGIGMAPSVAAHAGALGQGLNRVKNGTVGKPTKILILADIS